MKKTIWLASIAIIFAIGMVTVSVSSAEDKSAPRYSEICAHGHNGFDCKTPKHLTDILTLEEKVADLEKRVSELETR